MRGLCGPARLVHVVALVAGLITGAVGCRTADPPRPSLTDAPTHERYRAALAEFGLDKTALGRDWLAAADRALAAPVSAALPFREEGYFSPTEPGAVGYRVELRRGRRLVADVWFESTESTRFYVDLFREQPGGAPERVAGIEQGQASIDFEVRRDGTYVLRIQPELLRGGRYSVVERTAASLGFPVKGLGLRAVESAFGVPRDGGRRDHHGIDIFAPRGTAVVAAVDGTVRVTTNSLGGQVIWLRGKDRAGRLYYAHLNGWAVDDGEQVTAGQVIGYVGNTGNARATRPHLHFGVYDRGPADPVPFLRPDDPMPRAVASALAADGAWARVGRRRAVLHESASAASRERSRLEPGQAVRVQGAWPGFYRVTLPNGNSGFVASALLESLAAPLALSRLPADHPLLEHPRPAAPLVEIVRMPADVEILGWSDGFGLVRRADSTLAWAAPLSAVNPQ